MALRTDPPAGEDKRWSLWKLGLMTYPFAASAVAINLFMLGLLWQWVGLPALAPVTALLLAVPLGLPVAWATARWLRHLIDKAEGR
ncbi:MAG: hypothetical protein U1D35_08400 [Paracoccaceae bacterium]|nr:hypothetical protein [Paracoccaceae bacterium]